MSDYIKRSDVIDILKETGIIQDNDLGHLVVEEINRIPTVDEKEIIRKAFERVVERLEGLRAKPTETVYDTVLVGSIIGILKEECGINEED